MANVRLGSNLLTRFEEEVFKDMLQQMAKSTGQLYLAESKFFFFKLR